MVLGSIDKSISYPQSLYYSAKAYEFGYFPNGLMIAPPSWDDENNRWLASLFGLTYQRIIPPKNSDPDVAWKDYLQRIETALQSGSAVQTSRGWMGAWEKDGQITSKIGGRLFWWEGLSRKHRPDMHYFTIIGLDRFKGEVYAHDPVFGWYGWGRDVPIREKVLRQAVQRSPWQHRYITVVFNRSGSSPKNEREIQTLLKKRIQQKILGDDSVYDSVEMWREFFCMPRLNKNFVHGIKGLEAFKTDLQPERFKRILAAKLEKRKMKPVEVVSWIDLNMYHNAWVAMISADYLEEIGQIDEWLWLLRLHIFYEQLWMSSAKLRSVFKTIDNVGQAMALISPVLKNMRNTIDAIIEHFRLHLRQ